MNRARPIPESALPAPDRSAAHPPHYFSAVDRRECERVTSAAFFENAKGRSGQGDAAVGIRAVGAGGWESEDRDSPPNGTLNPTTGRETAVRKAVSLLRACGTRADCTVGRAMHRVASPRRLFVQTRRASGRAHRHYGRSVLPAAETHAKVLFPDQALIAPRRVSIGPGSGSQEAAFSYRASCSSYGASSPCYQASILRYAEASTVPAASSAAHQASSLRCEASSFSLGESSIAHAESSLSYVAISAQRSGLPMPKPPQVKALGASTAGWAFLAGVFLRRTADGSSVPTPVALLTGDRSNLAPPTRRAPSAWRRGVAFPADRTA